MPQKPAKKDRKKFDLDMEFGEFHEQQLAEVLCGKLEVKTDRMAWRTGNLAIEYRNWGRPSGISTTEAANWAFNLLDESGEVAMTFILPVHRLRRLVSGCKSVTGGDHKASRLFLVPMEKIYDLMLNGA